MFLWVEVWEMEEARMTVVLSPSQGEKPLTPAGDRFGRKPAVVRFVPRISYALDSSPREASWARSVAEKGGLKFGSPHLLPCAPCPQDGGGDRGLRGGGWLQSLDHGGGTGLEARPWHATSHNSSGAALQFRGCSHCRGFRGTRVPGGVSDGGLGRAAPHS